jgi:prevent-host-death family protein
MPAILKRKATKATPRPARRVARKPRATPGLAVTAPALSKLPSIVNVHEAKTQLSRLLARVAAGEEITIARAGQPFARLVPLAAVTTANPYLALGIADALAAYDRDHGQPEADFPEVWLHRTPPKPDPLEE